MSKQTPDRVRTIDRVNASLQRRYASERRFRRLGFTAIVLGLLFYMLWRGFKIAAAQPDRFGYLLAAGITWALFVNIAINIGVVTALLPVTGLPLPFLSYGGSSLLTNSAAVGVLLHLSRRVKTA